MIFSGGCSAIMEHGFFPYLKIKPINYCFFNMNRIISSTNKVY